MNPQSGAQEGFARVQGGFNVKSLVRQARVVVNVDTRMTAMGKHLQPVRFVCSLHRVLFYVLKSAFALRLVSMLVRILFVAVLGLLSWFFIYLFVSISKAPPTTQAPVIAGIFAVLVAVASSVFTRIHDRNKIIEQELRSRRSELYSRFVDAYLKNVLLSQKDGKLDLESPELARAIQAVNLDALIWGSNEFLVELGNFRSVGNRHDGQDEFAVVAVLLAADQVLQRIRRDLGYQTAQLKPGDLIKFILSNPEEINSILVEGVKPSSNPDS